MRDSGSAIRNMDLVMLFTRMEALIKVNSIEMSWRARDLSPGNRVMSTKETSVMVRWMEKVNLRTRAEPSNSVISNAIYLKR